MKTDDPSIYVWMGGRAAMLTTRQKLHLIAIEEEIAHLQLQMCMEECAYLGAAKSDDEKETNATAYIDNVIKPVLDAVGYTFETKTYNELQNIFDSKLPGTTDASSDTTHSTSLLNYAKATVSSTAKAAGKFAKAISKIAETTLKANAYKSIETTEAKGNCVMVLIGFATTENANLVMHITTNDNLRHTKETAIVWSKVWENPPIPPEASYDSYVQDFTRVFGAFTEKLSEKKIVSTGDMANKAKLAQIARDLQQHEKELKDQEAIQKAQIAAANKKAAAEQAAANRTAAAEAAAQQAEANKAAAAQKAEANKAAAAQKAEAAAQKAAQQAEANRAAAAKKAEEEAAKKAAAHPAPTRAPAAAATTHAPATQHAPAAATTHAPATQHAPAAATTRVPAARRP
jgi:hypothetical protein